MRTSRRVLAGVACLAVGAASAVPPAAGAVDGAAPYRAHDHSVTALNILPPGQGRYLNALELLQAQATGQQPPHNTDQLDLYESMIQAAPHITDIAGFFKDASFGVRPDDVERTYSPRDGLTVVRDRSYGVPHVYGSTRSDVMFGAGYVTAEDRLFMMDVLRHAGRGRLSELLGATPANLAMDRSTYRTVDYTEAELQAMGERLLDLHPKLGATVLEDVQDFADGVNAYIEEATLDPTKLPAEYPALQVVPRPWRVTDTVAVATLIGGRFGGGGGTELANAAFLSALRQEGYGAEEARRIMDDLHFPDDPEAWVHTDEPFPFMTDLGPVDGDAVAVPGDAAAAARQAAAAEPPAVVDGPFGPIPLSFPSGMSSALLVGAGLSESGRPLAVFGPQTGYWSPEILNEVDLHGPGIDARGVGFPGISMYVLLGRGRDYAWSATSAGGDLIDIYAVELCEPDGGEPSTSSDHYLRGRECVPIYERTDTWLAKPSAGGLPSPDPGNPQDAVVVEITTHRADVPAERGFRTGIIQARGHADGKPVAFVRLRSTYGAEVDSALTFVEILDPDRIQGAEDFRRAFSRFNYTFNWFYADGRDVAFQFTGAIPQRAAGVDPDLPVWAKRRWAWRRMVPQRGKPFSVSPAKGYITSWNNKQAPGFGAADSSWSYGPVDRVQLLDERIAAARVDGPIDLADAVNITGDAATADLRGSAVLPYLLQVVGRPGDNRLATVVDVLAEWVGAGAHRRDLDGDGQYEHQAAVALMDEWWPRVMPAVFRPVLGEAWDAVPAELDDHPADERNGSSWNDGFYGQVQKDLRAVLGLPVAGSFSRGYCGHGDLASCRADLVATLDDAVAALEARFGGDPAGWDADEAADSIVFATVGIQGQRAMDWQNRPTFQQVVEFGLRPRGR